MMEEIVSRLKNWAAGRKDSPSVIEFFMLDGCNQNCKFCDFHYNEKSDKNKFLKDKNYYDLIKQASKMKVDQIRICGGGEPLFNKTRILNMINLTKKNGMSCQLITNGTLFDDHDIKRLVELGMDDIRFSIVAPDAKTHDELVGLQGAFDKAISNLKKFYYWKKKLNKDKPFLSVYFILHKKNYKKLNQMIKFADYGISDFYLYDLHVRTGYCNKLKLNSKDLKSVKKDIIYLKNNFKKANVAFYYQDTLFHKPVKNKNKIVDFLKIDEEKYDFLNVPCYQPWYYLGIRSDGLVESCAPSLVPFNFNIKGRSLSDIWYGKEITMIREIIFKRKIPRDCSFCCFVEVTVPLRKELSKYFKNK
jgi:MoaA/NifB/PqqE/SkfB family radical SAM enzyme